jgi:hypothetical protein
VKLESANWKQLYFGEVNYVPQFLASYITKDAESTSWEISYFYGDVSSDHQRITIHYAAFPKRNKDVTGSTSQLDMWSQFVSKVLFESNPFISKVEPENNTFGMVTSANHGPFEITYQNNQLPTFKSKSTHGTRTITTIDIR